LTDFHSGPLEVGSRLFVSLAKIEEFLSFGHRALSPRSISSGADRKSLNGPNFLYWIVFALRPASSAVIGAHSVKYWKA
jgi:hypothetical protein